MLKFHRRDFLASTVGLAIAGGAHAQAPKKGGVLKVSANANPSSLDPQTGGSGSDHSFLYPMFDTLIDFEAAKKYNVKTDGSDVAATGEILRELADDVDRGKLEIPIARVYPLTQVREAFQELEKRHTHGKIVLVP